ncbi:MAG: IS66 family transposase [Pseudonocardiaceae bacterium]
MRDLDSLSRDDLIRLILELQRRIEELRKQNEELRRKDKRSAAPFSKGERKKNPKRPGRQPGQGAFSRRPKPPADAGSKPPVDVPVEETRCPFCGGCLEQEEPEEVSVTDMPAAVEPEVRRFQVQVCRCRKCGRKTRGKHPDVTADQYGATAHRLGPRIKAMAHSLHYGYGVPVRRLPAILQEMTGIAITQGAITQDALKQAAGPVGVAYRELRGNVRRAPVTYTDDTGWRVGGGGAYLMAFDTDQQTVYQIRPQHGNEQVREVLPGDYTGTLVTDRFSSYEAEELAGVEQHKCLSHLIRNVVDVVESKTGRAKVFGSELKALLQNANELWRQQRAGTVSGFAEQAEQIERDLTHLLRPRRLRDADNQRLLDGIGLQHDRQRVLNFLYNPEVEPTNNRAERALRPAVIARKVSQCSKNERGAEAFAAFTSVARTALKQGTATVTDVFHHLIKNGPEPPGPS